MTLDNTTIAARRWVLGGGVFNCIVAFPLAMPFLHGWYIQLLNNIATLIEPNGAIWLPPIDGTNMLFLNTAGMALFLVGMTLIYASKNVVDRITIPFLNGIVRFVWAVTAIYYFINYSLIEVIFPLVVIDSILAIVYIYYYFKISNAHKTV